MFCFRDKALSPLCETLITRSEHALVRNLAISPTTWSQTSADEDNRFNSVDNYSLTSRLLSFSNRKRFSQSLLFHGSIIGRLWNKTYLPIHILKELLHFHCEIIGK